MQRYYDAAHELRLRRSARTDVLAFARHIYPNFITGEHHKVIAEKLHAIANGEIKRLMIFCPPRHGKSVMVSQVFPAWYIGNNPTHQIMAISYNDELASDFGRRVRNTLLDEEYMRIFNGLTLAKDSKAVDRWNTSKGGIYIASGIGGTLHGRGANLCIANGQRVMTNRGYVPIELVCAGDYVFTHRGNWRRVLSVQCNGHRRVVSIRAAGMRLRCTRDHEIFGPMGWQPAQDIAEAYCAVGREEKKHMRPMWRSLHPCGESEKQTAKILLPGMLKNIYLNKISKTPWAMQAMRWWHEARKESFLLNCLRRKVRKALAKTEDIGRHHLPDLREDIPPPVSYDKNVLDEVQERSAQQINGTEKPQQNTWENDRQASPQISKEALAIVKETCWSLHRVRIDEQACCSSSGRNNDQRYPKELGGFVPGMPQKVSLDEIYSVEKVYDIQVEEDCSFLCEGFFVSNCVIDDPIRNRAEADSKRTRDLLWQSYEADILSRLMPGGAIVCMHTRWHQDDLAGRILEREKGWTVVSLPAISNEHTDKEQALWPEWFPLADMRERRSKVSARTWASLYQQNPQPDIGIFFDMNWFKKRYKTPPKSLAYYITTDFAVTEPDGKTTDENALPDFTEIAVWGIDPDENIYAIDWWFGQTTPDKWFDELCRLIRGYRIMKMYGEGGVIRRAVEAALRKRMQQTRAYAAIEWINPIHDKPTRARSFQALASMGKVYFPETASWLPHVLHQLVSFPAGRNDDAVDACSLIGLAVEQLIHSDDSIKVVKKLPRNVEAWRVV